MPNETNFFSKYALPLGVLILIAVAVGGWYVYQSSRNDAAEVGAVGNQFEWRLTPEQTAQGTQTTVVLRVADVDVPVGIVPGVCTVIDGSEWQLLENELSGVICESTTQGGQGIELGVFQEGGELVMKQGQVSGTERTNFVQITGN